jgi:hypothetical protein
MPYSSTPCMVATPKPTLWPFQEWLPTGLAACGRRTTPLDTSCHTPLLLQNLGNQYDGNRKNKND